MNVSDIFAFKNRKNLYIVGILGGIASGKTTIADEFASRGAHVINADKIAHSVLTKEHIQQQICSLFPKIFTDGQINRQKLAEIVFPIPENLKKLEAIVHPEIRKDIKQEFMSIKDSNVVVLDAPLLWESGFYQHVDTLVFVDTPLEIRRKRALENRGWDAKELDKREKLQENISIKKRNANYIVNNEDQVEVKNQIQNIWEKISVALEKRIKREANN